MNIIHPQIKVRVEFHQQNTRRLVLTFYMTLNAMVDTKSDMWRTDLPLESVYSGVVTLRGLRLVVFLAELNGLELWTTDIGNAYLEAETKEKVYIIAGSEFGEQEGHIMIIHKALYGLRSSGLMWHERLADCLRDMGFYPCKEEPDI
jgi:hypothetical protein